MKYFKKNTPNGTQLCLAGIACFIFDKQFNIYEQYPSYYYLTKVKEFYNFSLEETAILDPNNDEEQIIILLNKILEHKELTVIEIIKKYDLNIDIDDNCIT